MSYNTVKSVDELIKELERENIHTTDGKNKDLDKAISERAKKIEKLRKLRDELQTYEEYNDRVAQVQKDNSKLDDAINELELKLGKKKPKPQRNIHFSYGSESRCGGESNW